MSFEAPDLTVPVGEGLVNLRTGAIIQRGERFLMVGNTRHDYLYSVGGRIKFGESAEEAVIREVEEETGYRLKVNRLGFIHENFFTGDDVGNDGKKIYELSFFFYMDVLEDFAPVCDVPNEEQGGEFLTWATVDDSRKFYPEFFREALKEPSDMVGHMLTREW